MNIPRQNRGREGGTVERKNTADAVQKASSSVTEKHLYFLVGDGEWRDGMESSRYTSVDLRNI